MRLLQSYWLYWISPFLLLLIWWVVAERSIYSADIFIPPQQVYYALVDQWQNGDLRLHIKASLLRLFYGYIFGSLLGVLLGISMAVSQQTEKLFFPTFQALRQVPTIALIPIFILLLGVDESFKIIIVANATFLVVAFAAYDGTKSISKNYLEVGNLYQINLVTRYRKIILPAILPPLITGLRIAFARSWTILVAAELLAADTGIGQLMQFGREMFRLDVVMVGVVITGLVGFTVDYLFKRSEKALLFWK